MSIPYGMVAPLSPVPEPTAADRLEWAENRRVVDEMRAADVFFRLLSDAQIYALAVKIVRANRRLAQIAGIEYEEVEEWERENGLPCAWTLERG